jgi:hypothetical protein
MPVTSRRFAFRFAGAKEAPVAALIVVETAKWAEVVKQSGAKLDWPRHSPPV